MIHEPPKRLLDDPGVDDRLRRDLSHAGTQEAPYDTQAGLQALSAALDELPAPVEGGSPADSGAEGLTVTSDGTEWTASLRAVTVHWWGLSAVGLLTAGAVWWAALGAVGPALHKPPTPPPSTPAASQAGPPAKGVTQAAAAPHPRPETYPAVPKPAPSAAPTLTTPQAGSTPARRLRRQVQRGSEGRATAAANRRSSTKRAGSSRHQATRANAAERAASPVSPTIMATSEASDRQDVRASEVAHLARVRRLLASDPARALQAARTGQQRFASGMFSEERAALVVFALFALDRPEDARHAADEFLRDYSRGPFAARVRTLATQIEGRTP